MVGINGLPLPPFSSISVVNGCLVYTFISRFCWWCFFFLTPGWFSTFREGECCKFMKFLNFNIGTVREVWVETKIKTAAGCISSLPYVPLWYLPLCVVAKDVTIYFVLKGTSSSCVKDIVGCILFLSCSWMQISLVIWLNIPLMVISFP